MKKSLITTIVFLLVISLGFVSAININEVESNPQGENSGNQWIELYSESEFNLAGHYLENSNQDKYYLKKMFSEYYVAHLPLEWLNNNDKVYLKDKKGNIIDETPNLEDSEDNALAWSKCNIGGSWQFVPSSEDEENNCPGGGGSGGGGGHNPNIIEIYDCQILDQKGATYVLQNDVTTKETCFVIEAPEITLDLNEHTISGNDEKFGVHIRKRINNFTIKNGEIKNFARAIEIKQGANNGLIENIEYRYTEYGISTQMNKNVEIRNVISEYNRFALFLNSASNFKIEESAISNNEHGLRCHYCSNSEIKNNQFTFNTKRAILIGLNSQGNIIENNEISFNADGIALTSGPSNNIIKNNEIHDNEGGVDNVGIGIYHDSNNNLILNNNISSQYRGIWLWIDANNNKLIDNEITSSQIPLSIYRSSRNTVSKNFLDSNGAGIYLRESNHTKIKHNIIQNNGYGITILNSEFGLIFDNFFNNSLNANIINSAPNYWNTEQLSAKGTKNSNIIGGMHLGGNYWATPDGTGYSQTCSDKDGNGICDEPYQLADNNIDFYPLTY